MRRFLCLLFLVAVAGAGAAAAAVVRLPTLVIDRSLVFTAGCSHAADFAHQFHIAHSRRVRGTCVFSGQPFHCAVTRFARDAQVPQTPESSVPRCVGCTPGHTLVYDHCKNHPAWVDVGMLPDYVRRACGGSASCIDPPHSLASERQRVFLFHPTHDECYLRGAVANVYALYAQLLSEPERQLRFVHDQPFPHCLPTNSTPFFNGSAPSGYDGPGTCLRWLLDAHVYAGRARPENVVLFDQTEFFSEHTNGTGVAEAGAAYIPAVCRGGGSGGGGPRKGGCALLLMPNRCRGTPAFAGSDWDFARYGEANGIAVVKVCVGGWVDVRRFPNSQEVQRGLLDVYGQLGEDYALKGAPHMRLVQKVMERLVGEGE